MTTVDRRNERLIDIRLDEKSFVRRKPEVEHERTIAIHDLLEENAFRPTGDWTGPYALVIGLIRDRLILDIRDQAHFPLSEVALPLSLFHSLVRDYLRLCESYYDSIKKDAPSRIEAIDVGRRGLHDDGARLLLEHLAGHVEMDFGTARRLFTLICVLHIRG